ncbi:MAG: hypothetical protein OXG81_03090 [Acidobacteria bacterium]|nr:hypothetical protein [Acidobacteriota bacterium]
MNEGFGSRRLAAGCCRRFAARLLAAFGGKRTRRSAHPENRPSVADFSTCG